MNTSDTREQSLLATEQASIVERKPYSAPVLGEHGSVADTTQYVKEVTDY